MYFSSPWPGNIYPCAVGGELSCWAIGGPAPGTYTWTIEWTFNGVPDSAQFQGYEYRNLTYSPTHPVLYSVSVAYVPSEGGGPAHADGVYYQGIESKPNFDGATSTYLGVGGPRNELKLDHLPQAGSYGTAHHLWLQVDPGVEVYSDPTGGEPLTNLYWDDYSACNWNNLPSSVWVEAKQPGQNWIGQEYYVEYCPWGYGSYWSDLHRAWVMINCIKADVQGGVPEGQEEDPGDYLGGYKSVGLSVSGSELNGQGTVTLTWDADKVTVKQSGIEIESGKTWALTALPGTVDVSFKAVSTAFMDEHFHLSYSGHNTTSIDNLNMTVVEIVWMPLGQATGLTRFRVGRVYLPSRYGGTLSLTGESSSLYHIGDLYGNPNDWASAISIVKGERTPTTAGNPCTREAPFQEFQWYYVGVLANISLTPHLNQSKALPRPWPCPYYPIPETKSPNLYDPTGPLAKYDIEYGSASCVHEMFGFGYSFKHRFPDTHLLEGDAEMTVDYDFNQSGLKESGVPYDFWNAEYSTWVSEPVVPADGRPPGIPSADVNIDWWGHCDDATAAIICEPEPQGEYEGEHVAFEQDDKKGLLVALYHRMAFETPDYPWRGPDVLPGAWHGFLEWCILTPPPHVPDDPKPSAFGCDTMNLGGGKDEVWNYPIFAIDSCEYIQDTRPPQSGHDPSHDPSCVRVDCRVKKFAFNAPPGAGSEVVEHYEYYVRYDTVGDTIQGVKDDWLSPEQGRPDSVWRPWPQRNVGPWWIDFLDYQKIATIIPIQQQ